jgi:hypothetical protein
MTALAYPLAATAMGSGSDKSFTASMNNGLVGEAGYVQVARRKGGKK